MQYTKNNRIGKGTYGVVFESTHKETKKCVALKKFLDDEDGIHSTTLRELDVLKTCNHPNILKPLDIIINNHKLYVASDLYSENLYEYIKSSNPKELYITESLVRQIVAGVEYLHSNGIIHRDIKPQNIFVTRTPSRGHTGSDTIKCVIGDFGLARKYYNTIDPPIMTHEICTLWYRPPEVLLGARKYSTSVDIWSIGCVFAEIILKKVLLPGDSEIDQLMRTFRLLGTPSESSWDGITELSDYKESFPKWDSTIDNEFQKYIDSKQCTVELYDLIKKLLTMNPVERPDIYEVQKHPYLNTIDPISIQTSLCQQSGTSLGSTSSSLSDCGSLNSLSSLCSLSSNELDFHQFSEPNVSKRYFSVMFENQCNLGGSGSQLFDWKKLQSNIINQSMINILFDWFIDVESKFRLISTTLFRAHQILFKILQTQENSSEIKITPKTLQLTGVACLCIAAKLEEVFPPELSDYVHICDGVITRESLIEMEEYIAKKVDFKFTNTPLIIEFIRVYNSFGLSTSEMHTACKFFAKYCLFNSDLLNESTSLIAACICYKVMKFAKDWKLYNDYDCVKTNWNDCEQITRISETDLLNSNCWKIFDAHISNDSWNIFSKKLSALYKTFSIKQFGISKKIYGEMLTTAEVSNKILPEPESDNVEPRNEVPNNVEPRNEVPNNVEPRNEVPNCAEFRNEVPNNVEPRNGVAVLPVLADLPNSSDFTINKKMKTI